MWFSKLLKYSLLQDQKDRINSLIREKIKNRDESFYTNLYNILEESENNIINERNKNKSYLINDYVMYSLKEVPGESVNHTLDRIKQEINKRVDDSNKNSKYDTSNIDKLNEKKLMYLNKLKELYPNENDDILKQLVEEGIKNNQPFNLLIDQLRKKNNVNKEDKIIYKNGIYEVIEINNFTEEPDFLEPHIDTDEPSTCHYLFKGTKWCVRFNDYFDGYLKKGSFYLIRKNGKPYVLGNAKSEWLDVNNNRLYSDMKEEIAPIVSALNKPELYFSDMLQYIENPSEEFLLKFIDKFIENFEYIKNPSERLQLLAVKKNGLLLSFIVEQGITPSEEVKEEAVKSRGFAIQWIENPSRKLILLALKSNGYAIETIKDPSEELQLIAVKQNGGAIQRIVNKGIIPSEEVQKEAIKSNPFAIEFLFRKGIVPSEELQEEACKQNGNAIGFIENQTEQMKWNALKQNGLSIFHINDPTEEMKLFALKQDPTAFKYIKNPSEELQIAFVKQNGYNINHIFMKGIAVSERVQAEAIKQNPYAIKYITYPSKNIIDLYNSIKGEQYVVQ